MLFNFQFSMWLKLICTPAPCRHAQMFNAEAMRASDSGAASTSLSLPSADADADATANIPRTIRKGLGKGDREITLQEFKLIVERACLLRDALVGSGAVHNPWLAKRLWKLIQVDRLVAWKFKGLPEGHSPSERDAAFLSALVAYNISGGWLDNTKTNLAFMLESESLFDPPRFDFPPGIPFHSHTLDWSAPDPCLPQEGDIMWHESGVPHPDKTYDTWQVDLRHL